MTINIELKKNLGFEWINNNHIFVKGYIFDKDNEYYHSERLLEYFSDVRNESELINKLKDINGNFSLVINRDDRVFIAVDRLRSMPIFYQYSGEELLISDDAKLIKDRIDNNSIDPIKLLEFKLTGYTIGNSTLLDNVKQVQAGELIIVKMEDPLNIESKFYSNHLHSNFTTSKEEELFKELEIVSTNIFKRVVKSARNKMIVVPLSGGYDSRYILAMLKKEGYENVVCYTYGREDSFEVRISREVASKLGYTWYFIKYDKTSWDKMLSKDGIEYFESSHNYSSLPHIQDYIAIEYLNNKRLIDDNAIIIPGFCGDLLGGSYLMHDKDLKDILLNNKTLSEYIYRKHFNLFNYHGNMKEKIINNIGKFIDDYEIKDEEDLISINEHFFTCHKVSKFVINSLRVYEHFGYEWRMPLWDNELTDFWYKIKRDKREGGYLYNKYLFKYVFKPFEIDFHKPEVNRKLKLFKSKLPSKLQDFGMFLINKYIYRNKRNFNSFSEFALKLYEDVDKKKGIENIYINQNINHVFSIWFIEKILKI